MAEIQQIYSQRVNQLHTNMRNWLQGEPLILGNIIHNDRRVTCH